MARMNTDLVSISTQKSLRQIRLDVERAADSLRAHIDEEDFSPYIEYRMYTPDFTTVLTGPNFILGGPRRWGVQIMVKDRGDRREVDLVAVGDTTMGKISFGSFGNPFYQLGDSKKRRDVILGFLER